MDSPLSRFVGVGPVRQRELAELGLRSAGDLLGHLPHRYEDRRKVISVAEALNSLEGHCTVRGVLHDLRAIRVRRRNLNLISGRLSDGSGELQVSWFNRPYLVNQVIPGEEYLLSGKLRPTRGGVQLQNPSCERADSQVHAGRIVPIYLAAGKFGPAFLRRLISDVLDRVDVMETVPEYLPEALLASRGLPPLGEAIVELHRPAESVSIESLNARRSPAHLRLIYGEFFDLQLELALLRADQIEQPKPHEYAVNDRVREVARGILPFRLTDAQKRVLKQIVDDLRQREPMLRLLQGDVGSGKTIIAALALVVAFESGLQGAFMAPTELLAEQHFRTLQSILGERYRVVLLTSSAAEGKQSRALLKQGHAQLAVGTHALIQEKISFRQLGLCVIDEQHRFGVAQRRLLQRKGLRPDMLVMTATPIPRSLALTAYGDLEVSVLDELPPGRSPVATQVVPLEMRSQVYAELHRELRAGAQAYIVFPLIEESRHLEVASIETQGTEIRALLGDVPSAVLHGRMPATERDEVMKAFTGGTLRVLIATTVIEVGVDVPQATIMIIESAERFGLAQLHQLRGRVGRGRRVSRCVALHGKLSVEGERRLACFGSTTDGFEIAETDLDIRGPGELLGTRQAGLPSFRAANLLRDREWLIRARADARELLPRLEEPQFARLRRRILPRVKSRYERFAGG